MASDSQYAAELGAFDFYYSEMLKHLKVQKIQGNFISNGLVSGDIGHRLGGHQWQKMDTMLNEIRSNIALNGPSVFGRLIKALRDVQDYSHLANCLNSKCTELKNKSLYNNRNSARVLDYPPIIPETAAQTMPDVSRISLSSQQPTAGVTSPQNPLSNIAVASSHGHVIYNSPTPVLHQVAAVPPPTNATIDDIARQMTNSAILDQTVTMDIVVMIVPKVLTHWLDIGHRLRVEEHDLQAIDAELHNDERSACRNMLRKWLGTASARTPKTWRTFVQALLDLNIDHSRVIAVLEKELIQN